MKRLLVLAILFTACVKAKSQSSDNLRLKLINIDEVGINKKPGHPIIYMTGKQWKDFTANAVVEKYLPNKNDSSYSLKVISLGDDPRVSGVLMFADGRCGINCKIDEFGVCHCNPTHPFACRVLKRDGSYGCRGSCPEGTNCKMSLRQGEWGLIIVSCLCK
jgi:hypothetical protein